LADSEKAQNNVACRKGHCNKANFLAAVAWLWKTNRCPDVEHPNIGECSTNDDHVDDFHKCCFDGKAGINLYQCMCCHYI
jgi:hypothetical protein